MAIPDTVVRRSTPDAVVETLRRGILTGAIAGGTQLKQTEVAARFHASVVPVREAFQRLIAEGLAVHHPNRGVVVTILSDADLAEIAELRTLLEPHALRLSAPRLSGADLSEAEATLRRATETSDLLERARLHWDFHRTLYARSDRPRLLEQLGVLHTSLNRCLLPAWSRVGLSPGWVERHSRIVATLRRGDVDAACDEIVRQIADAAGRMRRDLRAGKEER